MKLREIPKLKVQELPRNRCVTLRVTEETLAGWAEECKENSKTLSDALNEKIRSAFRILFSAAKEEGEKG
jgi:hypothetical protein